MAVSLPHVLTTAPTSGAYDQSSRLLDRPRERLVQSTWGVSEMEAFLLILTGYVLGSMPWGYWLPRLLVGVNIREVGSGNTGAANVWRTIGFKIGLSVAVLDIAKGFAAALLGARLGGELVGVLAGIAAMIGHWRPLFMRFGRGGKMVATTGGVALALAPLATLAGGAVWLGTFLVTRYTSVASMLSAATLPLFAVLFGASVPVVVFAAGAAVAIVALHRGNIARLLARTENRFEFRRRRKGDRRRLTPHPRAGEDAREPS